MGKTFNTGRLGNGLFVDANGNVGIGTTSLASYFTSTLTIDGSSSQGIVFRQSGTDKGYAYWSSDFLVLGANTGGVILKTADTERARISSVGNILVGTTSTTFSGNAFLLRMDNASYPYMQISASGSSSEVFYAYNSNGLVGSIGTNGTAMTFSTGTTERMRIASNGKVGINTTTPDNTYQGLTIYGSNPSLRLKSESTGSWNWIEYVNSAGTNNFSMGVSQSTPLFVIKAGAGLDSPHFVMNTSGNIGIGTINPNGKLEISSDQSANNQHINIIGTQTSYNQSWSIGIPTSTKDLRFYDLTAGTERMRLTSDGKLRVNTTTSNGQVDIYRAPINSGFAKSLVVQGTGYYPSLQFGTYDLYDGFIATAGNDLRILAGLDVYTEDHNIVFYTSRSGGSSGTGAQNYERVRINYNGEFLVGTATASSADPVHRIGSSGGSTWARLMIQERQGTWISWNTGSANYGTVYLNGSVVVYGGQSDYRLKENIKPMSSGLDKIMQLKPVEFTWKRDGSYGEGFIAHELQEVIPLAVTGTKDGLNEIGEPEWQNVDKAHIVPALVKAVQELKAEIEILKNK